MPPCRGLAAIQTLLATSIAWAGACGDDDAGDFVGDDGAFELFLDRDLEIGPGERIVDSLTVFRAGYLLDLDLRLDIAHTSASRISAQLHQPSSGIRIALLSRPPRRGADIITRLDDAARTGIQDPVSDAMDEESGAFPAPSYRPAEPLELFYGQPVGGSWELEITNSSREDAATLRGWGVAGSSDEERPDPALYLTTLPTTVTWVAPGVEESVTLKVARLAGLEGDVELELVAGEGLSATPETVAPDAQFGAVSIVADGDAEPGLRPATFRAQSGAASRELHFEIGVLDFPLDGIELVSYLPLAELGALGGEGNDCWGWTDPDSGIEYALFGTTEGLSIVDLEDPKSPRFRAHVATEVPGHRRNSWRDVKVHADHAYVVSEAPDHGLQIIDLRELREAGDGLSLEPVMRFAEFGQAHNIFINEDSAIAYVVGADGKGDTGEYPELCDGGLLMLDLDDPRAPRTLGCFSGGVPEREQEGDRFPTDVYTHDVHCVIYDGPDRGYQGREICVTSDGQVNEDSRDFVSVVDVTDKQRPRQLSRLEYDGSGYAHQGWLTPDHRYFLFNDEFDEGEHGHQTRTYVWNLEQLERPYVAGHFDNPTHAISHNAYVLGNYVYQANYKAGLRVVDIGGIDDLDLREIAYFDSYLEDDADRMLAPGSGYHLDSASGSELGYAGAWSTYPYFESGNILVCDMTRGLFVVRMAR